MRKYLVILKVIFAFVMTLSLAAPAAPGVYAAPALTPQPLQYPQDEAIRQAPTKIEAYLELGHTYQDRREHLQALRIYRQAAEIAPTDFRPFYQAGLTLRESKDYISAQ